MLGKNLTRSIKKVKMNINKKNTDHDSIPYIISSIDHFDWEQRQYEKNRDIQKKNFRRIRNKEDKIKELIKGKNSTPKNKAIMSCLFLEV